MQIRKCIIRSRSRETCISVKSNLTTTPPESTYIDRVYSFTYFLLAWNISCAITFGGPLPHLRISPPLPNQTFTCWAPLWTVSKIWDSIIPERTRNHQPTLSGFLSRILKLPHIVLSHGVYSIRISPRNIGIGVGWKSRLIYWNNKNNGVKILFCPSDINHLPCGLPVPIPLRSHPPVYPWSICTMHSPGKHSMDW